MNTSAETSAATLARMTQPAAIEQPRPLVGVGVLVVKGDKVLVGRRKGSHGSGDYALPGGHLEYREELEECARREVLEETGLSLGEVWFEYAVNSVFESGAHYVTVFMRAEVPQDAEAQNLEPHKCEGWLWVPYHQVPRPVFLPLQKLLESSYRFRPAAAG